MLLNLPSELRLAVYKLLLPTTGTTSTSDNLRLTCRLLNKEYTHEVLKDVQRYVDKLVTTAPISLAITKPTTYAETKSLHIVASVRTLYESHHSGYDLLSLEDVPIFKVLLQSLPRIQRITITINLGDDYKADRKHKHIYPRTAILFTYYDIGDLLSTNSFKGMNSLELYWGDLMDVCPIVSTLADHIADPNWRARQKGESTPIFTKQACGRLSEHCIGVRWEVEKQCSSFSAS